MLECSRKRGGARRRQRRKSGRGGAAQGPAHRGWATAGAATAEGHRAQARDLQTWPPCDSNPTRGAVCTPRPLRHYPQQPRHGNSLRGMLHTMAHCPEEILLGEVSRSQNNRRGRMSPTGSAQSHQSQRPKRSGWPRSQVAFPLYEMKSRRGSVLCTSSHHWTVRRVHLM